MSVLFVYKVDVVRYNYYLFVLLRGFASNTQAVCDAIIRRRSWADFLALDVAEKRGVFTGFRNIYVSPLSWYELVALDVFMLDS